MKKAGIALRMVLMLCLLAGMVVLAGCGGGGDDEKNGGNGDANGDTETGAQWAAYAFGEEVTPKSGVSGAIKTFTIEETYTDSGRVMEMEINGEYLGTENTQIKTTRMSVSDSSETTVTSTAECYKVKHRVIVQRDDSGDYQPGFWADIITWIPTGELETSELNPWVCPKVAYADSSGATGLWSYYLTEAMQHEMNTAFTATYSPYEEGNFYGAYGWSLHQWIFHGLYGWAWVWFQGYTEGGAQYLEEGDGTIPDIGNYSCTSSTQTIDSYLFDAWSLTITTSEGVFTGTFSPDLPLPIHLKVGANDEDSIGIWEYTLTRLTLG